MHRIAVIILIAGLLAACSEDGKKGNPADAGTDDPLGEPSMFLHDDPAPLTELGIEAVGAAPLWLERDLAIALRQQEADRADELAGQIVDLDDPQLIDEVAFTIAHSSPETLASEDFYPELLSLNAALIYEHEPELDYVTLVEEGEAGVDDDFHTTATYTVGASDSLTEFTVDRETYYWYVVHPTIEDENPWYIDTWMPCTSSTLECAAAPGTGWFWREWLWDAAVDNCYSPGLCPVVSDWVTGVESVWDGVAGGAGTGAVREIISYMHSEPDEGFHWLVFGAQGERSIQPNRIYGLGRGNCGEWADITSAIARTALIPNINATPASWDHTWNSFWDGERWVEWEPVNVWLDHAYNAPFSNYGARGDGSILLQTDEYTDQTFTMQVEVTDSEGEPFPGAAISVWSPWVIDEVEYWAYAGEAAADEDGIAEFPLVAEQKYAVRIETPIGNHPPQDNTITYASDGVAVGETDLQSYTMGEALPVLPVTEVGFDADPNGVLHVAFTDTDGRLLTRGLRFDKTYSTASDAPELELLLVDEANYELYLAGEEFDAAWIGDGSDADLDLPVLHDWYLIVSNDGNVCAAAIGALSLELEPTTDDPNWTDSLTVEETYEILPASRLVFKIERQ